MNHNGNLTITALVGIAFFLAVFYPLYLLLRANWRDNEASRSLMAFSVVVAGVLGLAFFRRYGFLPPPWVGILAYTLIVGVLFLQDYTLVRIQRRQRARIRRERERQEASR